MLQQTTTRAVIPYFEKFLTQFPTLYDLARAPLEQVLSHWAGLGYYSRARNLHRSAQALVAAGGFPENFESLMEFPGFGPYTSRAVAALAFGQEVGVIDGNVIRVLCRYKGWPVAWWKSSERNKLQTEIDLWAQQGFCPATINQAVMELGASLCSPQRPSCFQCPLRTNCKAEKMEKPDHLPLKKPRRQSEIWLWEVQLFSHQNHFALIPNTYAPFLRGQWIFPGQVQQLNSKPKSYDFRHNITHYDIFVTLVSPQPTMESVVEAEGQWIRPEELSLWNPASLLKKTLNAKDGKEAKCEAEHWV